MNLVVVSYKRCWPSAHSPSGYASDGGFPLQMQALSQLFDTTTLVLPCTTSRPHGETPLRGKGLRIVPVEEPAGQNVLRKLGLVPWLFRNGSTLWRTIARADAMHAPIPGDTATLGLLVALVLRKPVFVRYCGTWGRAETLAEHFWFWLLERIAGGRNVVMATGGGDVAPSRRNPTIEWIFSTTISEQELVTIPARRPWRSGEPLRLVTVARLDPDKNTEAALRALPLVRPYYPQTSLDVVGDGPCREYLRRLAAELGVHESVTFHGRLTHVDVLKVLLDSQVFVFPTRVAEGFPKAVLEALACGLPVVAPPVSVLPRLIGTERGVLLRGTDHASVAESVLQLIADDRLLAAMSASARATSSQYTLERWQDAIQSKLEAGWGPLCTHEPGTVQVRPANGTVGD